jgi:hypothetical protein
MRVACRAVRPSRKGEAGSNEDLIALDAPELTSELPTRAISPTHPDKHPPERRELLLRPMSAECSPQTCHRKKYK